MRFNQQKEPSSIPNINLVPMMDVLMSVLTFFIILSISFTSQITNGVNLPQATIHQRENGKENAGVRVETAPDPLVIGLNQQGEILMDNQSVDKEQMAEKIVSYLTAQPNGVVILKADKKLSYKKVEELLSEIQKVGGDRVSLALH